MKKTFSILLTTIFLNSLLFPTGYAYPRSCEFLLETGINYYKQGKYNDALQEFKKALVVEPDYEPALRYIELLQQKGLIEEEVVRPEVKSAMPAFLSEIGKKFYQEGKYAEALQEFHAALSLDPGYAPALRYARLLQEKGLVKEGELVRLDEKSAMPAFLCEIGKKFYQQGKYVDALQQFYAALSLDPGYAPALRHIQLLKEKGLSVQEQVTPLIPPSRAPVIAVQKQPSQVRAQELRKEKEVTYPVFHPTSDTAAGAIKETLEVFELQQEMIAQSMPVGLPEAGGVPEKEAQPLVLKLDDSLSKVHQPVEIAQGSSIIVQGENIQRFLVVEPGILDAEQKGPEELVVTGKELGYTYVHVWDNQGRWTIEFLTTLPQAQGPTLEELIRREEERAGNFKLSYDLTYSSVQTGRRVTSLKESSFNWGHRLGLTGETPYGNLDSQLNIRSQKTTTDLTYFTFGLNEGKFGPFKGFTLRGFDYAVPFSNLSFSGVGLRGGLLTSPVFNKKLDYSVFWGREGGGRYANLSPGLAKIKNSFLEGVGLNFTPTSAQNYKFSLVRGWGRDRTPELPRNGYDMSGAWNLNKLGLGYEIAFDSQRFAHLFKGTYSLPKLSLGAELRDIDKNFYGMTGRGWRAGEFGGVFNLNYLATEKLTSGATLDIFQDRLFPAEFNNDRWNENFNWGSTYNIDPLTALTLGYNLQNLRGRLSPTRNESPSIGLSHRFKLPKEVYTYVNYMHQKSENFSSPSSSYTNNKVTSGLRFPLIGNLYYYLNAEIDWLQELYTKNLNRPYVYETGLDWSNQIGNTPFYGNMRFTYRNEENTGASALSLLSGQDYIDGYAGLSYRPTENNEIYASAHIKNIWADSPGISKRVDGDFNAGVRYLWDTGFSWEAVGNIDGFVFKDLNSDGLRQRDEAPVEGIKLWLGKDRYEVTDIFGYYKFKSVKARKAYVTLDASTLPAGFVLTVPVTQEVPITHHRAARIDFGIISRSEISGLVFEDVNGDGEYNQGDKGVQGAVITLDDGKQEITDFSGRYYFPNVSIGEHTITLDLGSLPVYYLPQLALTKKITLSEGVSYIYNIPLKRVKE